MRFAIKQNGIACIIFLSAKDILALREELEHVTFVDANCSKLGIMLQAIKDAINDDTKTI